MFQWHEGTKALRMSVVEHKSQQKCEGCEPVQVGTRIQAGSEVRILCDTGQFLFWCLFIFCNYIKPLQHLVSPNCTWIPVLSFLLLLHNFPTEKAPASSISSAKAANLCFPCPSYSLQGQLWFEWMPTSSRLLTTAAQLNEGVPWSIDETSQAFLERGVLPFLGVYDSKEPDSAFVPLNSPTFDC